MEYRLPRGDIPSTTPSRNLLLIHSPVYQGIEDFIEIQRRIAELAPDIEVRVATNGQRQSVTARWQVSRPSLVFSPIEIVEYQPRGGAVFAGKRLSKLEQVERLSSIGVPTPPTAILGRDFAPPPNWGEFLVVKPNYGSQGRNVRLVRARDLSARFAEITANGTSEYIVQPYVDHSIDGYPTEYRVLVLFGRALYCACNRRGHKLPPLEKIADDPAETIASNAKIYGPRVRTVCNDPEFVGLAERAHLAFPELPVLGVDVLRTDSGKLFAMEVNSGDVWHLSSRNAGTYPRDHVRNLYAQFGALERAAEALIEKTRSSAI
jgi:hypothetical protein